MVFGDADGSKSSDRGPSAEMLPGRFGTKQVVIWGCLIGASVGALTLTAQNVPGLATTDHNTSCTLSERWGTSGSGRVLGFLSSDQAATLLAATRTKLRATINSAYVANKRAVILVSGAKEARHVTALVPSGMTIQVGDRVDFASGYRDKRLPCSYVPNLINNIVAMAKPE